MSNTFLLLSFLLLSIIALFFYRISSKNRQYFRKRGIEFKKPTIFFGHIWDAFKEQEDYEIVVEEMYKKFPNEKLFGLYNFLRPSIIVKDLNLVNQLIDSNCFNNRDHCKVDEILEKSLFFLRDEVALEAREKLMPFFKELQESEDHFSNINTCANEIIKYYCNNEMIDTKDLFEIFYSNVIALSVLGIYTTNNYDEKSKMHEIMVEINNSLTSISGSVKILILNHLPWITKFFPIRIFLPSIYDFFNEHVIEEIKRRESRKIYHRKDFLQHLIEMRKESSRWNDGELIIAQTMSFFTAGFATTSTLFQACCFILAKNANIQNELYTSIENDSENVIDDFIHEALRKWTPIFATSRVCNKNISIHCKSGEIYNFYEGDLIEIPLRLINNDHHLIDDPKYFNIHRTDRPNVSFGLMPRECVGKNFAIGIVRNLLVTLLRKFIILPCEETPCEIKFCDNAGSVKVKLKLRN